MEIIKKTLLKYVALPIIRSFNSDCTKHLESEHKILCAKGCDDESSRLIRQVLDVLSLLCTQSEGEWNYKYKKRLIFDMMDSKVLSPLTFSDSEFESEDFVVETNSKQNKRISSVFRVKNGNDVYYQDVDALKVREKFLYNPFVSNIKFTRLAHEDVFGGLSFIFDPVNREWYTTEEIEIINTESFMGANHTVTKGVKVMLGREETSNWVMVTMLPWVDKRFHSDYGLKIRKKRTKFVKETIELLNKHSVGERLVKLGNKNPKRSVRIRKDEK